MNLLRSELLKIRTTATWWIFALGALLGLVLATLINMAWASALDQPVDPAEMPPEEVEQMEAQASSLFHATNLYTSGQYLGLLFVMLLGIVLVTNEYRHQTATTTFLTTPRREAVMLAKLGATAVAGAVLWAATTVINIPVGVLILRAHDAPHHLGAWEVTRALLLNLLAYLLWGALGIGIGTLIRSQVGATVTAAVLYLVGTHVAQGIFMMLAGYFDNMAILEWQVLVPSIASNLMITGVELPGSPPQWVGAVVLVGYATLAGVVGAAIVKRRDIS
ncbi:MAG TPA: ABC transporter permease subunit [Pilimelia sp.]|nr:ABC transporter permease subunit [Pilimelia sp.]